LALLLAIIPACYFSRSPEVPYPAPEIVWQTVPTSPLLDLPAARATSDRWVVVARFRSLAANPVGGLLDYTVRNESALWRTYFARFPEIAVMEGFTDRLRETGIRAYKDYTDGGNPALLEEHVRARDPLVLVTTVHKLRHDQLRLAPRDHDFEAVLLDVEVELREPGGAARARFRGPVLTKLPAGGVNVLQYAGAVLADVVLSDKAFRAALGVVAGETVPGVPPAPAPRSGGGR
jgi:hypothetical protein